MSIKRIAVKIGGIEHRPLDPGEAVRTGEVEYIGAVATDADGRLTMVWDDAAQNMRAMTAAELIVVSRTRMPTVSRAQLRLELHARGLLATVESAVAASNDVAVQIMWQDSRDFHRSHPLIAAMLPLLGITDQLADDIFAAARSR